MHELKWLLIGAVIATVGDFVLTVVLEAKRHPAEQAELDRKIKEAVSRGARQATTGYSEQIERLMKVLSYVSVTEPVVYGNAPAKGIEWSKLAYENGHNGPVLIGHCRGVRIRYSIKTGMAYVEWHDGSCWKSVDFDLNQTIPADKVTALVEFFNYKFERGNKRPATA